MLPNETGTIMTISNFARGCLAGGAVAFTFAATSIAAEDTPSQPAPVVHVIKKTQLYADNETKVAIREHNYAPGWTAPTHYHNSDLFIYVVSGAFEVTMEATGKVVYRTGEALKMEPETVMDARNASDTEPLKLAVFQVGHLDAPFVVPVE